LAYAISKSGSDWTTIHIMEVSIRKIFQEKLEFTKFVSVAWTIDGKGFYYSRYPTPNTSDLGREVDSSENQKVYYHILGTEQDADILVFAEPDYPKRMFGLETTRDGKYLLISVSETTADKNRLYYIDLKSTSTENGKFDAVKIIPEYESSFGYICNDEDFFLFQTNENAKNGKIISLNFTTLEKKEVIPESKDPLEYVLCCNEGYLVTNYVHNVQDTLKLFDLKGNFIKELPIPGIGQVTSISGRREDSELFYKFSSFTCPGAIFHYNFDKISPFYEIQLRESPFKLSDFETKQVWYDSKDGTKIPMFIVHKKNLKRNGQNPALLYGYGGFNISLKPYCSVIRLAFIHHFNAVFAMPNLRGGGEFGEAWHEGGILEKKQNVFDDFIAAGEWLISNKYTSSEKLVIQGGSNGGLLTAACVNQRPDLFACAIADVGVLDMLRFHKFTIGSAWVSDYGCSDKKDDFNYLIKYSPLHNVQNEKPYPAVLITTSDHDDRVVPLHSFKYAAQLQYVAGKKEDQKSPLMIRIEKKAGHGAGKPTQKVLEEYADIYSYITNAIKMEWQE
jgi:prolyl oligopeptidase